MKPSDDLRDLLPLREPTFFILLSLAHGHKHGYAIIKDVETLSAGKVRLSTSTLYEALARLLEQELVERGDCAAAEAAGLPDARHPGKPRKTYQLTRRGRKVVSAETARLHALLAAVRGRLGEDWALEREGAD